MKKLLLSLAAAAMSLAVSAEEVTFNLNDVLDSDLTGGEWIEETKKDDGSVQAAKHYQPVKTLTIDGYTFTLNLLNEKGTAPAFYYATSTTAAEKAQKSLRVYKETELTFTAPAGMTMGTVTFTGTSNKATVAGTQVSTGKLLEATGSSVVWTGEANSFTLTLDGTVRVHSVTISTEGQGGGEEPSTGTTSVYLNATDANGFDDWTLETVDMAEELEYVWAWKNYNNAYYLNGSAFKDNTAYASEVYAVSPVIDLAGVEAPVCSFEHAAKFQTTLRTLCGMVVREEGTSTWTPLTIPTWPEAGSWTFAESGEISLAAFAGKKIQVAFKYASDATGADTWEIRNLTFNIDGGNGGDTPVTPEPTPAGNLYLDATDANGDAGWTFDNVDLDPELEYVWAWKSFSGAYYLNGSGYKDGALAAEAIAISPVIDLTNATAVSCSFEHAAKFQTTLRTLCGMVVREEGTTAWTALTIPTWPEAGAWTWAESGNIDLAAYAGKKIQVGFKYGSSAAGADTWEIRNLKFDISNGVADVEAEAAEAVYYNLQGVQMQGELTPGLYIRRQGNTASKVIVK